MVAEDPFVYVQDVGSTVSAGAMVRLDGIFAALRAVEAVRAFAPKEIVAQTRHEAVAYAFGYRDGVEAVQALLEGE